MSKLNVPMLRESVDAKEALKLAIIGIFCFGIILAPLAISRANKAKRMMDADPTLGGRGQANAAIVIAIGVIFLWIIGIISRASGHR